MTVGRGPGDAWLECGCGRRHWGRFGAAGLLLVRSASGPGPDGAAHAARIEVLLQHRALWSDQGGTWALPGGALREHEDPVAGALREAAEEVGVDPARVAVAGTYVLDHGVWRYTTVIGRATGPQDVRPTDDETLDVAWVAPDDVDRRPLLVAFAAAWPALRQRVEDAVSEDGSAPGR